MFNNLPLICRCTVRRCGGWKSLEKQTGNIKDRGTASVLIRVARFALHSPARMSAYLYLFG